MGSPTGEQQSSMAGPNSPFLNTPLNSNDTLSNSVSNNPSSISSSHYDHTPLRGVRTVNDIYSETIPTQQIEFERVLLLHDEEPANFFEAKGSREWQIAMKEELDSIERNGTWSLVKNPPGVKPIGLKWVYKIKKDAKGDVTRYKARLVAKGYVQKRGVDYDEVFALVTRMETVRLILSLAGQKSWRTKQIVVLIVWVYVDDLLIAGSSDEKITNFKKQMKGQFDMSDLGLLNYYLGIQVTQDNKGVSLKQTWYAIKILKEANMWEANSTKFPMEPGLRLTKKDETEPVDPTEYRKLIGRLRYITRTRPEISYAIGLANRFMETPKTSHWQAVKQVLRYLSTAVAVAARSKWGTINYGIRYAKGGDGKLIGCSDISHATDWADGKSTTGMVFYYGGGPITWCTLKQSTIPLSSCEAEFMAANAAACQAVWLKGLLEEITRESVEAAKLCVDNQSAILLIKNHVFHGHSKHINTRYHFIRECVENGLVTIEYVADEVVPESQPSPDAGPSTQATQKRKHKKKQVVYTEPVVVAPTCPKKWTPEEEFALSKAWVDVSEDPIPRTEAPTPARAPREAVRPKRSGVSPGSLHSRLPPQLVAHLVPEPLQRFLLVVPPVVMPCSGVMQSHQLPTPADSPPVLGGSGSPHREL
ncbi:hypothetical protein E3N88_28809 [Mikania micrantha]|uniref:Reverse transcriptase Ty1/copia-type domain-containing protein n=1 Tax=Mikania micrantha TaxID=192012 RepID=A0A5N6N0U7_9ASTR|nr:hypothetical protein E3N88_28809 [Mikania micrantha]